MKVLFLAIITLIAGVILAMIMRKDPGYILMGYGHWSVEMSLSLFIVLLLLFTVSGHYALRLFDGLRYTPKRFSIWRERKRQVTANNKLTAGLLAEAEGNWKQAEKNLIGKKASTAQYLAAARAAQMQGAPERVERYLQQAQQTNPDADVAVALTQAELQIESGQLEQALASLMHIRQQAPKNKYALKQLILLYQRLNDWPKLHALLTEANKKQLFNSNELAALEKNTYLGLLQQSAKENDVVILQNTWSKLPKHLRHDHDLIKLYSRLAIGLGESKAIEPLLRESINQQWDDELVYLYGLIENDSSTKQLNTVENWLIQKPNNPTLLLTAGRLSMREQLWGKARPYLENSAKLGNNAESYHCLAKLLEQTGENEQAVKYYQKGLELADESLRKQRLLLH